MTFALTKVEWYGIEIDEPLTKRFHQRLVLQMTAANTDVDFDLGDYTSGTFWTAIGTSTNAAKLLLAGLRKMQAEAITFVNASGTGLLGKVSADSSIPVVQSLTSAAYGGGSATPTLAVTGLLTTDTILGAQQVLKNQNSLPLIATAAACTVADQYGVTYSADPGTTGTVKVIFSRATTAVQAGTYQLSMDATNTLIPNFLFLTGEAPTVYALTLDWELKNEMSPLKYAVTV